MYISHEREIIWVGDSTFLQFQEVRVVQEFHKKLGNVWAW